MLPVISKVAASILLSASTLFNPTTPKTLSFGASAYVTVNHEIRVAVEKSTDVSVVVLLRDKNNDVLYRQNLGKKESRFAMKLNVDQLADGVYELEVKSSEGSIRKQLNLSTEAAKQVTRSIALQ
ncbi:hypothetical protein IC229_22890 [Spirosoma sp. BT702]|uniref:Secretion system C-terminal sorting domain-containing protein n=1 Tax=Spirosoma profusum TaxID=2771354 RepID=A0A926Y062_9BACT|nr:hypothetical protein [Spirosoma profusum]MBD2703510.1 hypothetical protein [Spirosoma profusum]